MSKGHPGGIPGDTKRNTPGGPQEPASQPPKDTPKDTHRDSLGACFVFCFGDNFRDPIELVLEGGLRSTPQKVLKRRPDSVKFAGPMAQWRVKISSRDLLFNGLLFN